MTLPPEPDRWTLGLAAEERVAALAAFGFTERQAQFLLTVLLHAGVFVERQYCAFAGIVHGQKSTDFLARLVEQHFATPIATGKRHRGRMIHVHYKPLWAAIGEPDSRFRKAAAPGRMIERVMLLDAVLDNRALAWIGPSWDRQRHFVRLIGNRLERLDYPHLVFGEGPHAVVRFFPDKLPIGVHPETERHVFVYLVTRPSPVDFRQFLLRHVPLLRALRQWTIRLLLPHKLLKARLAYLHAAREHLACPLHPKTVEALGPSRNGNGSRRPPQVVARRPARRSTGRIGGRCIRRSTANGLPTRATPSGSRARTCWRTPSIAERAASSASSSRANTSISLRWSLSPNHLQPRTTSGTTSRSEVVPFPIASTGPLRHLAQLGAAASPSASTD